MMKKSNTRFTYLAITLLGILVSGCGGGSSNNTDDPATNTYSTTSTRGDYAEWTLTGSTLNTTWQVIDDTGLVDYTLTLAATCGIADIYGMRSCTIDTSSCADGESVCPSPPAPGDSFEFQDAPGVGMFAITDAGMPSEQLHVGLSKDDGACTDDVSGDYSYVHLGLGGSDIFGLYRSDADFVDIKHTDFGFETSDANSSQTVEYTTTNETPIVIDGGCINGVRERTVSGNSIRLMVTASGSFILDFPAGGGGLFSFNIDNAASLADFAGKSFSGISFPEGTGNVESFNAVFGAVAGSKIDFTKTSDSGTQPLSITDLGTTDTTVAPSYPDFTSTPTGYELKDLFTDYPTPDDIPGLFKIGDLTDPGRIIMSAMKFGAKVIAVGVVYDYRTTSQVNPATGLNFDRDDLYNTGEFILFEN